MYNNLLTSKAIRLAKATATLPQGVATAKFTVNGRCIISDIVGEVTTVIGAGVNNMKLIANPTVGADVDLCAVVNIGGNAVGTMYNITGTLTDAMKATTSGAFESQGTPIIVADGTIDLSCSGSMTGSVKWTLFYIPLDINSRIS